MFFENKKEGKEATVKVQESPDTTQTFIGRRLPYNMENVMETLLRKLISKDILSVNDAKQIMRSGKSYFVIC
jgi:hypothetical protein